MEKVIAPVKIKNTEIGVGLPKICIPIVGKTTENILSEADTVKSLHPDLIEWRVDFFDEVEDLKKVLLVIEKLQDLLTDIPLIFTCRIFDEGGHKKLDESYRLQLIHEVIRERLADLVDIELIVGREEIEKLINVARTHGVKVIVSNHDFQKTPAKEVLVERLLMAAEYGADIAKIAAMPIKEKDVLTLLEATLETKEKISVPLITMSMSKMGVISRIAGGIFGSCLTFAAGKDKSAPGQISIESLKAAMMTVHE